ncbi:MAG TPA: NAD-dependent epimerase/dehydratase family protein [bacterium]|nr:NAD-dependent epimerase/dehydratase family protein [bacterium]
MVDKLGNIDVLKASCNIQTVQDGRGAIFTWIPDQPIVEFNMLHFLPNKIRGNHYHSEFVEYFLVVSGTVVMVTKDPDTGKEINMMAGSGICFRTPQNTPHAVHAITQSVCISLLTKPWDECNPPIVYEDLIPFNSDYVDRMKFIAKKDVVSKRKTVAVLGAAGFVGREIAKVVLDSGYHLIPVDRRDNAEELIADADIVVHSANPAGRMRAEDNPEWDFGETVDKTIKFFALAKGKRFIQISTMSCRTQLYGNYGRNRRVCELLVASDSSLVIRLGPMYGGSKKKDMLHDILAGRKVYVSEDTSYAYTDVVWNAQKIVSLLGTSETGIREIGASNAVRLGDLRDYFASDSEFSGIVETQIPENCPDGPDANDVYEYAKKEYVFMVENNLLEEV